MIGGNIDVDKLLDDIEQQVEILSAIAGDNAILSEQLRLLQESREVITAQLMEMERLGELVDPDAADERLTIIDRLGSIPD